MHGNGNNSSEQPVLKNLKHKPYGGAGAVPESNVKTYINNAFSGTAATTWLDDDTVHDRFLTVYNQWIRNTKLNQIEGLDAFPVAAFANGTSEGFDKFYLKNHTRRFRCYHGEYMYHPASWRNYFPGWSRIEDEPLHENDAVVVSLPFSDTGDVHSDFDRLTAECTQLGVPVLVDMAFYGIVGGLAVDLDRPCVTDITFSLSKTFPIAHARAGMRLTREDDDDSLLVHHKTKYTNRLGAGLGIELMQHYPADYNYNRWRPNQERLCRELGVEPSKSVIFGIDTKGQYSEYNRGAPTSRLCIANYLEGGYLPTYE